MKKILVIGACGQIGTDLTLALRQRYGAGSVIAADLKAESGMLKNTGPFLPLDILDKATLSVQIRRHKIDTIYLLAAMLSASGEQNPQQAWQLNMQSLLNTLEAARETGVQRIFWPSSIAVFGPDAPKINCPQEARLLPSTVYGISKAAGEAWCAYYHRRYGLDVRSLRYPGLISYQTLPGGGTTDYAVEIFSAALKEQRYSCFLKPDTFLPMMYMEDAVRATIELMETPADKITIRTSYNLAGISFSPAELSQAISNKVPGFEMSYLLDFRQAIADGWPGSVDDSQARKDWGWNSEFGLTEIVEEMMNGLCAA